MAYWAPTFTAGTGLSLYICKEIIKQLNGENHCILNWAKEQQLIS